jgi:hypothetical protein
LRHALTNAVAASCGEPAGDRGTVVVVGAVVVVVLVVGAELDDPADRGVASELQPMPMKATAHTKTAVRRFIEST